MATRLRTCAAITLALAILGCDKKSSSSPAAPSAPAGQTVSYLYVTGPAPATGATSQFTATAVLPDGTNTNVTSQATWKTSNAAILTVSTSGVVTGVAAGTADVSATYSGLTGTTPVTVSTLPCQFAVQPSQISIPKEGGSAQIMVTMTMGVGCAWTAQANQPFMTITAGASGTGNGIVALTVAPNSGVSRSGMVIVAGTQVAVSQGQGDCVTGVTPPTVDFSAMAGSGTMSVIAPDGCAWAASSSSPFLGINGPPTGTGSGNLQYTVGLNATGGPRQGAITVGRFQHTATQRAFTGSTYLIFASDPGDQIGQGKSWVYVAPDALIGPSIDGTNHLQFIMSGPSITWFLQMAAPNGAVLTPGVYENAKRFAYLVSYDPMLSIYGDGRGCNKSIGRFEVREAVYGPGPSLIRFWATFEQHCELQSPALRGEISFGR